MLRDHAKDLQGCTRKLGLLLLTNTHQVGRGIHMLGIATDFLLNSERQLAHATLPAHDLCPMFKPPEKL